MRPKRRVVTSKIQQIDLYSGGKKRFPALVNELDAGIRGLLDNYADVCDRLRDEWRKLEEVNALALDEGLIGPLNGSMPRDFVRVLRSLV